VRLAVSNIAWTQEDDGAALDLLVELGLDGLEVAPTRLWPDPLAVPDDEVRAFRARCEARGIPVVALQALLFGRPELRLFEDESARRATLAHLRGIARVGGLLGAGPLVFGSPANRRRGALEPARALEIAERFFRAAGEAALEHGTCLCLEPNPPQYGCDFATDAASALELVRRVDHPGFGLHLDAAALTLAGDAPGPAVAACASALRHFHASEAQLAPLGEPPAGEPAADHAAFASALRAAGYRGFVSLEMRAVAGQPAPAGRLPGLRRALERLRGLYGGS
jgi:sugar phosphate isomerase/epimerase